MAVPLSGGATNVTCRVLPLSHPASFHHAVFEFTHIDTHMNSLSFYFYYFTIGCTTICLFIFCSGAALGEYQLRPFVVPESQDI